MGKPKIVFSKTLERVDWNSRLVRGDGAEEVARLKQHPGGDLSVGGPTLAATLIRQGLIDEYWTYVNPVILGGGKPMYPSMETARNLRLIETRQFTSGVVLLHYENT